MNKKLMFGILLLLAAVVFSAMPFAAAKDVNYTFYNRTILEDGTRINGTTPVTDVRSVGYVCLDSSCSQLGAQIPGLTGDSGDENWMILHFPSTLQNANGYGIYFYADGYIPWEQIAYWEDSTPDSQTSPKYLARKEGCSANILGVSVLNEVAPNMPLIITVPVQLNASVFSAFHSNGPIAAVIPVLGPIYSSIRTEITATIYDSYGNVVDSFPQTITEDIMFDDSVDVSFEWTPAVEGDYVVEISTDIPAEEEKCLSSHQRQSDAFVAVLAELPHDMCYTRLNMLSLSNQTPAAGQPVNIMVQKISNSADALGDLTVLPTALELWIVNQRTGQTVDIFSIAPANANINDFESFTWEWTPAEGGFYDIYVTGIASDCLLPANMPESVSLQNIYVSGPYENIAPIITSTPKKVAFAGEKYKYDVNAYDPDDYPLSLTYSLIEDSPQGMTIDSATGLIEWTPAFSKVGEKYSVTVQVSDGLNSTLQSYDLEVASKGLVQKVEQAPEEETQADQEKTSVAYAPAAETSLIGMPVLTLILLNATGFIFLILILKLIFASVKLK